MRKLLAVLVVTAATASLVVGSGGFSSASADRAMSVDVVGDDEAYMSLEYAEEPVDITDGEAVTVVTVANQFTEQVDIAVDYDVESNDGVAIKPDSNNETSDLGVGQELGVAVELNCQASGQRDVTVSFDANATGDNVSAETSESRHVEYHVECGESTDEEGDS